MGNQGSSSFFKPKPLRGQLKSEQHVVKWFKKRGVENVGRVWIDPEPKDYLSIRDCEALLHAYAQGIKECDLFGYYCKGARTRGLFRIYMKCGMKIKPPSSENSPK